MFVGILLVSQLVLVLMSMLDAYAMQLYIVDSTNTGVVVLNVYSSYTVQSQSNNESKCGISVCQISEHSM